MLSSILDSISAACSKTPQAPALLDASHSLSYAELDALSDRLAWLLMQRGLAAQGRVVIHMAKCVQAVAGIYAVWKCGASYVPLDPALPAETKRRIVEQSGAQLALVDAPSALDQQLTTLRFSDLQPTAARMPRPHDLEGVAAILYTSGSTGTPKGVAITHRNLAVFADWARTAFGLHAGDRLLSHAPFHFDLSFFDLFAAAGCGGCAVIAGEREIGNPLLLARWVAAAEVTIWQSVPSALTLQVAAREPCAALERVRHVLFAGERMPRDTLLRLAALFPQARLHNVYGCTETNDTLIYTLPLDLTVAPDPLPIGYVLPHIEARVVDERGQTLPRGQQGELWVAGQTVMAGYTAPAADGGVTRQASFAGDFYRTRDLVQQDPDGAFRFLGRLDSLVKVRGQRVNLSEVEQHLSRCEGVAEVVVFAVPDPHVGMRLVAVARARPDSKSTGLELALRAHCIGVLSKPAIPQLIRICTQPFPRTATGKVDRRALAASFQLQAEEAALRAQLQAQSANAYFGDSH